MNQTKCETYANTVACCNVERAVLLLPGAGEEMGRKGFLKIEGEVLKGRVTNFKFKQVLHPKSKKSKNIANLTVPVTQATWCYWCRSS